MAVESIDPVMAARWRQEAGISSSLEAAAVQSGLMEMTERAHQNLMETNADYAVGHAEAMARREAELIASWDKAANEKQAARGIDPSKPQNTGRWSQWQQQQDAMNAAGL